MRNGVAITGATALSYTLTAADEGALISFEVIPITGVTFGNAAVSTAVIVTTTLSIAGAVVVEGSSSGATNLVFTFTIGAISSVPVSVDYTTADGTALSGEDYVFTNGTLTITAGSSSGTVTVIVFADTVFEGSEVFSLMLNNPVNARLASASASGILINDDAIANNEIVCHGDSWTMGSEILTPWPDRLSTLLGGRVVTNRALNGRTSAEVAAVAGAQDVLVTLAGNTIPAFGSVDITMMDNADLGTQSDMGTQDYSGFLFGVHGTISVPFNGIATFTRTVFGTMTQIPSMTPFLIDDGITSSGAANDQSINIIWMGINNFFVSPTLKGRIISDIDAMVVKLSALNKKFIILTIYSPRWLPVGSTDHSEIMAINNTLLAQYPLNVIDIRGILMNAYDQTQAQDVIDFSNDVIPTSLTYDGLHPNDKGAAVVSLAVQSLINQNGW